MAAATHNVTIDQGADWFLTLIYKNSDGTVTNLTDFGANLQLRTSYDASSPSLSLSTGYLGVRSTTSDALSTGSTTFSVSATSAFIVGQRVRAASTIDPTKFQEGVITSKVTDTSVTIAVDVINGTGTFASWVFSTVSPTITMTPLLGKISIHATATQTNSIVAGDYVYDLEITSSRGIVTRVIQGRAIVRPQVTR
jgi:hypothetical protein